MLRAVFSFFASLLQHIYVVLQLSLSFVFRFALHTNAKTASSSHASRMNQFYEKQAKFYDNTRVHFLHGRKEMITAALKNVKSKNPIWIDLGCGTAQLLDFISDQERKRFKRIILVDICEPLLQGKHNFS